MKETNNFLTQEEISQLKEIREEQHSLVQELGQLEYNRSLIDSRMATTRSLVVDAQSRQETFVQTLTEKYGDIVINIEDGSFEHRG